LKVKEEAVCRL